MVDHVGVSGLDLARDRSHLAGPPLAVYTQAGFAFLSGATLIAALFRIFDETLGRSGDAIWYAFAAYAGLSVFALTKLPSHTHTRFGSANVVTTLRAAVTAAIGGFILGSDDFRNASMEELQWVVTGCAAVALLLDGVDGHLARRTGISSRFGARFDMETDALLILLLAAGAFILGKAGIWVVMIGLMRYAFIAAQWALKRLSGDLPESTRRKAVCVVQGVALCAAFIPAIAPPVASIILTLALMSLLYSFAVDVAYLWRTGGKIGYVA